MFKIFSFKMWRIFIGEYCSLWFIRVNTFFSEDQREVYRREVRQMQFYILKVEESFYKLMYVGGRQSWINKEMDFFLDFLG